MNRFLIVLFALAAIANVFLFFVDGHDADKITIAMLFVALTLHTISDYFQSKARR